ncbi:MAG: DegQ family serine endoprotease [Rhodospirillaceae bacterium]|jgi:Do/DeqQ family serine protease|nr:DegQ family serine endoprotease [Rhodospirillaceae bacterium]
MIQFLRRLRPVLLIGLGLLLLNGMATAVAQKKLPQSRQEIQLSYAPLVKRAAPAVVNIYTKRVVQTRRSPFADDPFFRQFFGSEIFNFGVPKKRVQNSLGSGVILRPEGIIVTNNHVIDKADQITVVLSDRRELDAKVILADDKTDLAVLRVEPVGEPLPFLKLRDSDDLEVGDLVLAIGNPFGVGQTVTSGIVSALARAAEGISDFSFFIQTDAAINPGNSGGALISMDGQLIGVNTAIFSKSGGSMGIGFAIPANMVARVVDSALHGAKIVRPWFGAAGQEVTTDLAASLGVKRPIGVLIIDLYPNGPADRAGLKPGDVITGINGRDVAEPKALRFRIATLGVGDQATLRVIRRGQTISLRLPIEAPPETPKRAITKVTGRHPLSGVTVANLSPALAEEISFDSLQKGVIVLGVARRSPARRIGIRPADILVSVNGQKIQTVERLRRIVQREPARWDIAVRRNGKVLSVQIEG